MLGVQGLWAERGLYCATPAVTQDLSFSGFIQRIAPFSRLLHVRHTRGCGRSILTRILSGLHSVTSYDTQGDAKDLYSYSDPHGFIQWKIYIIELFVTLTRQNFDPALGSKPCKFAIVAHSFFNMYLISILFQETKIFHIISYNHYKTSGSPHTPLDHDI
jgi:hypothetical protein